MMGSIETTQGDSIDSNSTSVLFVRAARNPRKALIMPWNAPNTYTFDTFVHSHLYFNASPMERTPYTSDTLIDTLHWLHDPLNFLSTGIPQQLCLLQYLARLQTPYTDCLFTTIDIVTYYDWVLFRPWRDCDFDLRVCGSEFREWAAKERALILLEHAYIKESIVRSILHALRASGPVTVVEVESFALQNKGAHAILKQC